MTNNHARNTVVLALSVFAVGVFTAPAATQAHFQEGIRTAVDRASNHGVPAVLLENKAREGIAKGVPAERIAQTVQRRAEALGRARLAFERAGMGPERAELTAGANALEGGVSEEALQAVAETSPDDRRVVAVVVLTQLVAQGKAAEEALVQVMNAVEHGSAALAALPAQPAAARGRSGIPAGVGPPAEVVAGQQRGRLGPTSN